MLEFLYLPGDNASDVIRPCNKISLTVESERGSQNLTRLSKWPLIMLLACNVTKSLQLDPANIVFEPKRKIIIVK